MLHELYVPEKPLSRERDLTEQCAELERELGVRYRCFRMWIAQRKLSTIDAADRYERLASALKTLERMRDLNQSFSEQVTHAPDSEPLQDQAQCM